MLREMWFDGKITAEEDQELKKVRQMFSITQREHDEAEKQVHIEAYVDALKTAWRDGVVSSTESEVLQLMRQRFNISMEEHMSAETQILWARNKNALSKGTILIVDDDRTMLLSLAAALKKHGYEVLTAESVDKATKQLELASPMLILSDLMFGQGEKTGLEFYQHVRTTLKFRETPFLLMSGISDEFVVRAGMRMGIDEFLKKPFSLELLLATIEGKLHSPRTPSTITVVSTHS
jgi:PleD family two-component response regulator